jgi:hypothetical protein
LRWRPDNIDGTQFFYAFACYCGGYSACAHKMAVRKTPEFAKADAIAAWNRRASTQQPTQAQAGAVPFNKAQRTNLFNNRDLASAKNMGVKLTLAEWHRIVQYIESAHGIKGADHG